MRTQKANNTPAPRAKALPAMAIVGHITVTREGRILVAKNGRHVEAVECTDESLRETVRTLARAHFGVGGVLRRSKQSTRDAHVYLVFR